MPELTISDDLLLEVCLEGETPLLRLHDKSLKQDGDCLTGILIWPNEIRALIEALSEAAGILAEGVS